MPVSAQRPPGSQNSSNMHVMSHVQLPSTTDVDVEQELSRPYVYASSGRNGGFYVISIKDPARARIASLALNRLYLEHVRSGAAQ